MISATTLLTILIMTEVVFIVGRNNDDYKTGHHLTNKKANTILHHAMLDHTMIYLSMTYRTITHHIIPCYNVPYFNMSKELYL